MNAWLSVSPLMNTLEAQGTQMILSHHIVLCKASGVRLHVELRLEPTLQYTIPQDPVSTGQGTNQISLLGTQFEVAILDK